MEIIILTECYKKIEAEYSKVYNSKVSENMHNNINKFIDNFGIPKDTYMYDSGSSLKTIELTCLDGSEYILTDNICMRSCRGYVIKNVW